MFFLIDEAFKSGSELWRCCESAVGGGLFAYFAPGVKQHLCGGHDI